MVHCEQENHSCYIGIDNGYSQLWATGEIQLQQQPAVTNSCGSCTVEVAAMRQRSGGGNHGTRLLAMEPSGSREVAAMELGGSYGARWQSWSLVAAMELGGSRGAWWQPWSLVAVGLVEVEAAEEGIVEPSVVVAAAVEAASAMAASVEVAPVDPVGAAPEELAPVEVALVEAAPEELAAVEVAAVVHRECTLQ